MSAPLTALQSYLRTVRWSGSDLARALGVSAAYVNGCLAGTRKPGRAFIRDCPIVLGPLLGVDPDDLRRVFFGAIDSTNHQTTSVLERRVAALEKEEAAHA